MNGAEENKDVQLAFPFQVIEEEILNPISGYQMTEVESFVAELLLDATSEKPMKMKQIIDVLADAKHERVSERQMKIIIRTLRRDRGFPILTRRSRPAGYFWCRSVKEFKEFEAMWTKQTMDELTTLQLMKRRNYPKLAGQKLIAYTESSSAKPEKRR
jgi:hypothetical protein